VARRSRVARAAPPAAAAAMAGPTPPRGSVYRPAATRRLAAAPAVTLLAAAAPAAKTAYITHCRALPARALMRPTSLTAVGSAGAACGIPRVPSALVVRAGRRAVMSPLSRALHLRQARAAAGCAAAAAVATRFT
jgi:hypothetical protein